MSKRPKHKINPYMEHYEQFQKELAREMKIDQFGDLLKQHTKKIKQLIDDGQLSRQQYLKYASKLLLNSKSDDITKVSNKSSYFPYQIPSRLAFSENVSQYDKEIEYLKSNDYRNYLSSLLKGVENEKDLIKEMKNARSNSIYLANKHSENPSQIQQPVLKKNFVVPTTQFSPIRKIDQKQSQKCLNNQRQKSLNRLAYLNNESFDLFAHQINQVSQIPVTKNYHQKKHQILKEINQQRSLSKAITKLAKQRKVEAKCENSSIFWQEDVQENKKAHLNQKKIQKQNINYSPINKKSLHLHKDRPVETSNNSIYTIDFKLGQLGSKNETNKRKCDGIFYNKQRSRFGQKQTRQTSVSKSLSSRSLCRKKSKLSIVSSHTKV